MNKMAPDGSGGEVILIPPRKALRSVASKSWCFTLNNYTEQETKYLKEILGSNGSFILGYEIGESGTPHIQGYVKFHNKCRPMEKIENKRIHWEKCKGTELQNIEYCTKDKKFYINFYRPLIDPLEGKTYYEWQQKIFNVVSSEEDTGANRHVHWVW